MNNTIKIFYNKCYKNKIIFDYYITKTLTYLIKTHFQYIVIP